MKKQSSSLYLFELVAKGELTPEEAAQIMSAKDNSKKAFWDRILDFLYLYVL